MKTSDFDYPIPQNLIAQFPSESRDDCRLLSINRSRHSIEHRRFNDLSDILKPGDRLIFNDTKVLPARLHCRKYTGAAVELLFTECIDKRSWKALVKPGKNAQRGFVLHCEKEKSIRLRIDEVLSDGARIVTLEDGFSEKCDSLEELLLRFGEIPLPHYIKRQPLRSDNDSYQTVYAKSLGAIAAPTAGLHFSDNLLMHLKEKGISSSFLTLHVGIGTFKPVEVDDPREHQIHEERFILSKQTVDEITETRRCGGRIIAVGTTVVRALEHCTTQLGTLVASSGATRLMILPGFAFKAIDGMITNFHVPQSTLLMLVCAFAGKEFIFEAYSQAMRNRYQFFSYGDAMVII
jgi:S-adenosylmethionine:tRNA ribosyltransferase-isomerase